jgi:Ca2+-binding RTX toxin-like protein
MMASPIRGNSDDNVLRGGSSDDRIYGYSGDDELRGRGGDDVLKGGAGDDRVHGGSGDDRLSGGSGDDFLRGGSGDDELKGGTGDDQLYGGSGDDRLEGGSGDDQLFGGSGDDELKGGSGDDELAGGSGDDELKGGSGDDLLNGGIGDDRLTGGSGDDTFRFSGAFGDDVITDLHGGDKIDLTAFSAITHVSQLVITQVGNDTVIMVPGSDDGVITVKGMTPAEVTALIEVACLVRGTLVQTPLGQVPVEALAIGDEICTIDGVAAPIKWIGRRAYARPFLANGKVAPVCIKAHALGQGAPVKDLYVSPDHAICVDGKLVPAKLLTNGRTVFVSRDCDYVEYYHLEFDEPQVILTNGLPTESYVESGNRQMFANYEEYLDLYGDSSSSNEPLRRYELVASGAAVDAIRGRFGLEIAQAS